MKFKLSRCKNLDKLAHFLKLKWFAGTETVEEIKGELIKNGDGFVNMNDLNQSEKVYVEKEIFNGKEIKFNMLVKDFFKEDGRTVNWEAIEMIPEFAKMKDCMQSKVWHKEGNVWNHTKLVTNEMCERLKDNEDLIYYQLMVVSAICHDLGKVPTTYWSNEKQDYVTENHGSVGDKITRRILFEEDIFKREFICWMVRWHMDFHHILMKNEDKIKRCLVRMSYSLSSVKNMLMLNLCDSLGSINDEETKDKLYERYNKIEAYAKELGCLDSNYTFGSWEDKYKFFINKESLLKEEKTFKEDEFTSHVYVMIGLPGAGKSTYVERLVKDSKKLGRETVVISRDIIRSEMGLKGDKPMGNKKQEDKVTEIFNEKFIQCLKERKDCVLDNTNLCKKYRDSYTRMMIEYKPTINYVYVEPKSIDKCKERREGMMPTEVIDRMFNYTEFPTCEECDNLFFERN